jgi:hypothetical protein
MAGFDRIFAFRALIAAAIVAVDGRVLVFGPEYCWAWSEKG